MAPGCCYLHSLFWVLLKLGSASALVWGSKSWMRKTERLWLMYPVEQLQGGKSHLCMLGGRRLWHVLVEVCSSYVSWETLL